MVWIKAVVTLIFMLPIGGRAKSDRSNWESRSASPGVFNLQGSRSQVSR